MYRFVSATHVLLNSSLDMSVYLINEYICMKDDLQLGKLKENCLLYRKLTKMFLSPRRESNIAVRVSRLRTGTYRAWPSLCHLSPGSSMVRASHRRSEGCGFASRLGLRNIFLSLR